MNGTLMQESTRTAVTETLLELAAEDPDIVLICSDSVLVIKGGPFADKYPDRFFDMGIAEQNAVCCAAGLASCGLIPFVATYAGFLTMRACEQVRTFVAYPGLKVRLIGANGGIGAGEREGVTHQFFEDIGILRTIPGITVVVPADASQVREAVRAVAYADGPAYVRIGSGRDPVVFKDPVPFRLGKARVLREDGSDVSIFANGFVLPRALRAAELLLREGVKATVTEVHTLKPIDVETIAGSLGRTGAAVTVEDHNIIGGLGSAVSEIAAEEMPVPVIRVGLRDVFPRSGASEELLDHYHIGVKDIMDAARNSMEKRDLARRGSFARREESSQEEQGVT
jgi:transketolase